MFVIRFVKPACIVWVRVCFNKLCSIDVDDNNDNDDDDDNDYRRITYKKHGFLSNHNSIWFIWMDLFLKFIFVEITDPINI